MMTCLKKPILNAARLLSAVEGPASSPARAALAAPKFRPRAWRQACGGIGLALLLAAPVVRAGLKFEIQVQRYSAEGYVFWTSLYTDATPPEAPLGHYIIRSPQQPGNGTWRHYELTAGGLQYRGGGSWGYNGLASALAGITNGTWTLTVTNETSTNVYAFQVADNGFAGSPFPTITITYPAEGAVDVPPQPTFTWQGTAGLAGNLSVYAFQRDQNWNWTFYEGAWLDTAQTSWTLPVPYPPGQSYFAMQYWTNHATPLLVATTPLHVVTSQPVSGWESASGLTLYTDVGFSVAAGAGDHALVAHYAFDNAGFLGEDSSPRGNHILNGSSWGLPVHDLDLDSIAGGGAVRFYGNSAMAPPLAVTESLAGSFTVSAWVKTSASVGNDWDDAPDGMGVVSAFMGWNTDSTIPIALTGSRAAFWTGSPVWPYDDNLASGTEVNTGDYVHLAVTRDQATGQKRLYVNGVLEGASTGSTRLLNEPAALFDLTVGGRVFAGYDGLLDDLQFYSGVLSATQIATLYNNPGDTIPDGTGGDPLGIALNAPQLAWTTGGEGAWFAQTAVSHDGVSAAQSGAIDDDSSTWLETQVVGPGTLSFWWKVSCEWDFDSLQFYVDGWPMGEITGDWDWEYFSMELGPGPHTLRWEYTKDGCCTEGEDAGWVDLVQFGQVSEVEAAFELAIVREYDTRSGERFLAFPGFNAFTPDAVTYHSAISPNGWFEAQWNGEFGSSSRWVYSLQELIDECNAGPWTLYVNKGDPSEKRYTFNVSIQGLTTNILGPVRLLSPVPDGVGVPTNAPFYWTGPTNLQEIYVGVYQPGVGGGSYTNLTSPATNWPSPPTLPAGTNECYVHYQLWDAPFGSCTTPVDANLQPVASWTATTSLRSSTTARFVVGTPGGRLQNPQLVSGGLQFAFQTLAGRPHAIEATTNLTGGAWQTLTNFPGDGTLKQCVFPTAGEPMQFFRARTD